jgi:hypothetical protein
MFSPSPARGRKALIPLDMRGGDRRECMRRMYFERSRSPAPGRLFARKCLMRKGLSGGPRGWHA